MSRVPSPSKITEWSDRLERFRSGEQTVAQFCTEEGVSPPSFYKWKKRLGASPRRSNSKPAFKPIELISLSPPQRTTIRWTDGIEIELGNDMPVIDRVLQALVSLRNSPSHAEGRSC